MSKSRIRQADIEIGQRLRVFRMAAGLSQTVLAEGCGISFQQIQKYEKGVNRLGGARLVEVANLLGVPAHRLLGEAEPESEHPLWTLTAPKGALELLVLYGRMSIRQRQIIIDLASELAPLDDDANVSAAAPAGEPHTASHS